MWENGLIDKKTKINFKIYNDANRETSNYNRHIFLNISRSKNNQKMEFGQLIEYTFWKHFSSKIIQKLRRLVPDLFLTFKCLHLRQKQVVCTLVSIYFDSPRLGHTIETNRIKLYRLLIQR